jgi:5'-phosphate synthase pdxT subunit
VRVGIVALQGAVTPHRRVLEALGHEALEVRVPDALTQVEGLVLPGGESTTQALLWEAAGIEVRLREAIEAGLPTLATCAGLIALARMGALDLEVERNGYGAQLHSRVARADSDTNLSLMLIRAPRIVRVGPNVRVHARYRGDPVWVSRGRIHATTFHPELTGDDRLHREIFDAPKERAIIAASDARR